MHSSSRAVHQRARGEARQCRRAPWWLAFLSQRRLMEHLAIKAERPFEHLSRSSVCSSRPGHLPGVSPPSCGRSDVRTEELDSKNCPAITHAIGGAHKYIEIPGSIMNGLGLYRNPLQTYSHGLAMDRLDLRVTAYIGAHTGRDHLCGVPRRLGNEVRTNRRSIAHSEPETQHPVNPRHWLCPGWSMLSR